VKRRKGNRENIPAIKGYNGRIITDSIDNANSFNSYYSTDFSSEGKIPPMQREKASETFTIDIKIIRRKIRSIRKNKSEGQYRVSGEILKLGGKP
jgi:hypothetical protein